MSTTRQVIDWQGQEATEVARVLADLPRGRYVLVPENELVTDGDDELSSDDESAAEEGLDDIEQGATVLWDRARADLVATIATARASRTR